MGKFTYFQVPLLAILVTVLCSCSPKGYEKYSYLIKDHPLDQGQQTSEPQKEKPSAPVRDVPEKPDTQTKSYTSKLLKTAESYLGVPYRYGGMSRKGTDCSGLVCMIYENVGINLPHSSQLQSNLGASVSMKGLEPGDLVFFRTRGSGRINHVGMITKVSYNREIYFIHASTSKGVRIDRLDDGYWRELYEKGVKMENKKADLLTR